MPPTTGVLRFPLHFPQEPAASQQDTVSPLDKLRPGKQYSYKVLARTVKYKVLSIGSDDNDQCVYTVKYETDQVVDRLEEEDMLDLASFSQLDCRAGVLVIKLSK